MITESVYYFFIEKGSIESTPIGYIISQSDPFRKLALIEFLISFIINMSVSVISLNYIYKWQNKMSTEKIIWNDIFNFYYCKYFIATFLIFSNAFI